MANFLAAEYVLGVFGARKRREFEGRLARDTALASEVASWEERLVGLADAVAQVAPPVAIWWRIETAIGRETAVGTAPSRASIWQSLTFWRSLAVVSATLVVVSVAALAYVSFVPIPTARTPLMATLGGSAGQPNFVAT